MAITYPTTIEKHSDSPQFLSRPRQELWGVFCVNKPLGPGLQQTLENDISHTFK